MTARSPRADDLVTYGELLGDATGQVTVTANLLSSSRLPDAHAAQSAITQWRHLLEACRRHGWTLLGSQTRAAGMRASARPDPVDVAAAAFVDGLARTIRPSGPVTAERLDRQEPVGDVAAGWAHATRLLGAASDLLATHRGPDGVAATPEALQLDTPGIRAHGLHSLTGVALPALGVADTLLLRARQAGVTRAAVDTRLPMTGAVLDAAVRLRALTGPAAAGGHGLDVLAVARPAIRTSDPMVEVGDRLARLRRAAWAAPRHPHLGITALLDIARTAVTVHDATLSLARRYGEGPMMLRDFDRVVTARGHWRTAVAAMSQLRTAAPGNLGIRADAHAITTLLDRLTAADSPSDPTRALPVLAHLTRAQGDVASWIDTALLRLQRRGDLYIRGGVLTGNDVTNRPDLVRAKLNDGLIPAPPSSVDAASSALRLAADARCESLRTNSAAPALRLAPSPTPSR